MSDSRRARDAADQRKERQNEMQSSVMEMPLQSVAQQPLSISALQERELAAYQAAKVAAEDAEDTGRVAETTCRACSGVRRWLESSCSGPFPESCNYASMSAHNSSCACIVQFRVE